MTNPNDPAFIVAGDGSRPPTYGLTKRELFAGLAMAGLCANSSFLEQIAKATNAEPELSSRLLVGLSLLKATALITELNREEKK